MTIPERAQLALLLEVASTPKPGNVDRRHEYADLRFEHFLAGAVGAREGLAMASAGDPVGEAFERAVAGMAQQEGSNTQFGAILLLVPLVRAAATGALTPDRADAVVRETTTADAAAFYRAFDYVDVAVAPPPEGETALDVRRGGEAVPAVEERGVTLRDIMAISAAHDGVAREWTGRFERSFDAADRIASGTGPIPDRAARVFLELLAEEPDTFVVIQHDAPTAREVVEQARGTLDGERTPDDLAADLIEKGINPGTTADLVAAGLYIALERGEVQV